MKNTQSQYANKKQPILHQPYKESSFSFLAQCHRDRPVKTVNDSFQFNRLKKSYKRKLNLHQIKIQVDSLCQQKQKDLQNQAHIINQLKQNESQFQYLSKVKSKKSQSFKRQLKTLTQNRKSINTEVRQNCHSLFNEGFLPDVKKFYSAYKNIQRQNERASFLRNSLPDNQLNNQSLKTLKLAWNIRQEQIAPRRLGMIGSKSVDRINSSSAHLTKKQYRILAKGISLAEVHKIGLSNNKLSKQSASLFVKNLPQKVEKLNLKNTIKSKDILQLLNSQSLKQGKLKKLNLSFNKITDTGLECIQQVLSHNSNLEILNLSNNFITDQSTDIIGNFIKQNYNLRNLNLSWNQFTGKNVFILFDVIQQSKSLLNLNFSRNKIGDSLSDIVSNVPKIKQNLKQKNQNKNNKEHSSLRSLCKMIQTNSYLLHFDLSYNKIQSQECQKIAQSFNLFNQTLVGFHMEGNSNYFQNQFGFLVKNQNTLTDKQLTENNLFNENKIKRFQKNYTYTNFDQQKSIDKQSEKCWLCHGWVTKNFTFQIDRKNFQLFQAFKNPFSNQPIPNEIIKNVYIHLECYSYQPVLMKCKKKIKSQLIDRILQKQKSLKTFNSQNETIIKSSNDMKNETLPKQKKIIISNTVTNLGAQTKNQNTLKENQQVVIYSYSINLKIPSNKKFKYFFTIDGQPFIDQKSQTQKVKFTSIPVQFRFFNPFQQILSDKVLEVTEFKQPVDEKINQALQLFQSLIGKSQTLSKQNLNMKLFLSQYNIYNPDRQLDEKQQKSYLEKYLLQKVYKKLLTDNQQLTEQQYNALIKQRVRVQQVQNEGSDKFISSEKLIQTRQLDYYEEQNESSVLYVKPRSKDLFYGKSDAKTNFFDITYFFKLFIRHLRDTKDQKLEKQFEKYIQKNKEFKHTYKSQVFYPFKNQLNTSNDYFNLIHFQKLILKQKVQIDSFNGKILKINHFQNMNTQNSLKNSNYIKNTQKDTLLELEQKLKLSQILPYALISYQNEISNRINQNSSQNQSGIFSKLQAKSRKKIRSKSKRTQSKMFKRKIQAQKQSQQLKTQPLNLSIQQKSKLQSQAQEINRNKQEKSISPQNQDNCPKQLCLDQLNQDQIISIRLMQEIFQYKKEKAPQIQVFHKEQKHIQQKDTFDKFVQKLKAWKQKQIQYSTQEKQILSLIHLQISKKLQEKNKKVEQSHRTNKQKSNKFNLKINKFCSLKTSSPEQKTFQNTLNKLKPKKRPTVDFRQQSPEFLNQVFQNSFKEDENIGITFSTQNINQSKVIENLQLFFLFDKLFFEFFKKSSTQMSVEWYNKKINKFLGKNQRHNHIKSISKTSSLLNNKIIKKDLNLNKNISKQLTQKSQKGKTGSKNSTKNSFFQQKLTQNQEILQQLKIEKNLFQFLEKLKQQSEQYFNVHEQIKFPFIQKSEDMSQVPINLNDFILRRFDYITLNIINNLDKIKEFKCSLLFQTKQVFLKEILSYRTFLLNSEQINFKRNLQKLLEIVQQKKTKNVKTSQKFIQKMQIINFNGIIDLLYEYILFIVYFITKLICFLIMSNSQTLSQQFQSQTIQENKQILRTDNEAKQVILEKDEQAEDQSDEGKIEPKKQIKTQRHSLIEFIKNKPERFRQKLQKLTKSVLNDIIITITKLHMKYDEDLKKVKEAKKGQQTDEQKNQQQKKNQQPMDENKSQRKKSIFSRDSSKSVSKEKNRTIRSKKIKNNSLRKSTTQGQLKQLQSSKNGLNLLTIKEKKVKVQKKRIQLTLNRGKKVQ